MNPHLVEKVWPATVRHISKNHVVITPSRDYSVEVFGIAPNGEVEAFVVATDGSETIRLLVAAPSEGQKMQIKKHEPTGVVDIIYTTEGKEHV